MELNSDTSNFAAEYRQTEWGVVDRPPLDKELGQEVAINLFKSFFINDAYARMVDLEVQFIRKQVHYWGQNVDTNFPIKIRRLERNDAPSPVDDGFTVECGGEWLKGLRPLYQEMA